MPCWMGPGGTVLRASGEREHEGEPRPRLSHAERLTKTKQLTRKHDAGILSGKYPPRRASKK